MRPQLAETMPGSASLAQRKAPVTFTSKVRRHPSGRVAATGRGTPGVPALFMRMVTSPSSARIFSKQDETETSSATSNLTGRAALPREEISRATETISSSVRAARAMAAPSRARRRAVAAPIPRPARSEEHTSELQSHSDLHSFPTRRSSDLPRHGDYLLLGAGGEGDGGALAGEETGRRGPDSASR